MSEEQREIIIKKYINTSKINPAKGKFYIRFKIKPNSGVVKFEPSNNDVSHHNLLKSDDFTLDSLEIIETVKFI